MGGVGVIEPSCAQVAQFLTLFQNQYRAPLSATATTVDEAHGDPRIRVVSWTSIERALRVIALERREQSNIVHDEQVVVTNSKRGRKSAAASTNSFSARNKIIETVIYEAFSKAARENEPLKSRPSIKAMRADVFSTLKLLDTFELCSTIALSSQVFLSSKTGGPNLLNFPVKWPTVPPSALDIFESVYDVEGICPNALTWREFARLALVTSCLNGSDDSGDGINLNSSGAAADDERQGTKMSASDVLSLWLRAQRSPISFRQLLSAFAIEKVTTVDNDDEQHDDRQTSSDNTAFKASFTGGTGSRLNGSDALIVDLLSERMVSNAQLILFDDLIAGAAVAGVVKNKRKRLSGESSTSAIMNNKKAKKSKEVSASGVKQARNDTKSMQLLLRLFAWRNLRALRFMLSSDEELKNCLTPDQLRLIDVGDRTLVRIHRKIQQNKYWSVNELKAIVMNLVETYYQLASPNDSEGLRVAVLDLEYLFRQSVNVKVSKMGLYVPSPWFESCDICKQSFKQGERNVKSCESCGCHIHNKCNPDGLIGKIMHELKIKPEPLLKILHVDLPEPPASSEWGEHCVTLVKSSDTDIWGVSFVTSEECMAAYEKLISGQWNQDVDEVTCVPLNVKYTGLVVDGIRVDSVAERLGLKTGDVVTRVEVVTEETSQMEEDDADGEKTDNLDSFDLSTISDQKERLEVMRRPSGHLRLIVRRSASDFFEEALRWGQECAALHTASITSSICDAFSEVWYCGNCCSRVESVEKDDKVDEAKYCRALVRRLGLEWCSLPFHGDLEEIDYFFSTIIDGESFASDDASPIELLCNKIGTLFENPNETNSDSLVHERAELAKLFFKLFRPYCIDMSIPPAAVSTDAPWTKIFDAKGDMDAEEDVSETLGEDELQGGDNASNLRHWLSYIGGSLLLLKGDKLLSSVPENCRGVNGTVFIVVTFKANADASDGTFCAIPLNSCRALQDAPLAVGDTAAEKVPGAIFLSSDDFLYRVAETANIRLSIDEAVAQLALEGKVLESDSFGDETLPSCLRSFSSDKVPPGCSLKDETMSKVQEYVSLIDGMCRIGSPVVRDVLEDVLKSRPSQRPSQQQTSYRPVQYAQCPELETDVGESDDDESFMKVDMEDDAFSDEEFDGRNEVEVKVCYVDFNLKDPNISSVSRVGRPNYLTNTKSLRDAEDVVVMLHRKIDKSDKSADDGDDDEWNPSETEKERAKVKEKEKKAEEVKYNGKGWGLELYRWSPEKKFLRVGRRFPGGRAAESDLQANDVIVSINGVRVNKLKSNMDLAMAMLPQSGEGAVNGKISASKSDPLAAASLMKKLKEPVKGPIVLEIKRPKPVVVVKIAHSSKSSARSKSTETPEQPVTQTNSTVVEGYSQGQAPSYEMGQQPYPLPPQPYVGLHHLYSSGLPGSLLTWAETVVMMEAAFRGQPVLGIRLLCPRYDASYLRSQYRNVVEPYLKHNVRTCPRLSEDQWKAVIVADYQRSLLETGPIVFQESGYSYRNPHQVLPLDRLLEGTFANMTNGHDKHAVVGSPRPVRNVPQLKMLSSEPQRKSTSVNTYQPAGSTGAAAAVTTSMTPPSIQPPQSDQVGYCNNNNNVPQAHGNVADDERVVDLTSDDENPKSNNMSEPVSADFEPPPTGKTTETPVSVVDDPERIRGGGNASKPSAKNRTSELLADYPVSSWVGLGVYGKCMTTLADNTEAGEALFIGKIETVLPESESCSVTVIYVNKSGYLPSPVSTTIHPDLLRVITGEAEQRILDRVGSSERNAFESEMVSVITEANTNVTVQTEPDVLSPSVSPRVCPNYAKTKYGIHKSRIKITIDKAAKLLMDRLCHRVSSSTPIGVLPDGSSVCWFQSDPNAIYIRQQELDDREVASSQFRCSTFIRRWSLRRAKMGSKDKFLRAPADSKGFCCPWGCSIASKNDEFQREILSFSSRKALDDHIDKYHIYRDQANSDNNSRWIRIPEGRFIQSICADITSACCAMNIDLMRVATEFKGEASGSNTEAEPGFSRSPFPGRMIFKHDALLDLTGGGRGSLHFSNILFALGSTDVSMRCLLRLWSRLSRLFAVESNGKFRLGHSKCLTRVGNAAPSKPPPKDTEVTLSDVVVIDDGEGKADESMESIVSAEELLDDIYFGEEEFHGDVRYELMTDVYFPEDRDKGPSVLSHKMDILKDLLLRLASRVPYDLKTQLSLWDKPYFQRWTTFVKSCRNGRMFMQALILLQNGVLQTNLPKWWNRGRGWCSSFGALSGVTSMSNFALRLFVLDAAIAEYIKTKKAYKADASEATDTDDDAVAVDNVSKASRGSSKKGKEKPEKLEEQEEQEQKEEAKAATCIPVPSTPFELLSVEDMVVHLESHDLDASYSRLMKMKFKDRMKSVSDIATKLFIRRFEGISGDLCRVCASGGDLLCCEYCNQVQHMECCRPILHKMPDYDFICDDCVKDINVSHVYSEKFPRG